MHTLLSGRFLYLTLAWGIVTGVLILLSIHRSILSSKEEGKEQVYLDGAEAGLAAEVQRLGARLLRLSKPVMTLSVLSLALLLVIVGVWLSVRWNVLGPDEIKRRFGPLF